MIKLLSALLIGTALISPTTTPYRVSGSVVAVTWEPYYHIAEVDKTVPDPTRFPADELEALIERYATQFHVKQASMRATIACEALRNADGSYDATAQSNHYKGQIREDSWGLSQINLPSNPHVTREQAQDPEFAIRFMAEHFANDRASMWTCWRQLFASGKI